MAMAGSFLRHAFVYGAGSLLLRAAGFFLLPIYLRCLTPSDIGILELLERVGQVLTICLLGQGVQLATYTFYQQTEGAQRNRLVSTVLWLTAATSLLGVVVAFLLAGWVSSLLQIGSVVLVQIAALGIFLDALSAVPVALLQARMQSTSFIAVIMTQFTLKIGLSILFVVGLGWGVAGVLTAAAITSGCCGLALSAVELFRNGIGIDLTLLRQLVVFVVPFIPGGLCYFTLDSGDRFFLLRYGDAEVGLYATGYKIAMLVGLLSMAPLYKVWSVRMYQVARMPDAPDQFGQVISRILGAYVALGLAVSLFQNEILLVLGGNTYASAGAVVAPVVLAYFFLNVATLGDAGFYVCRRTALKFWILLATTVVTVGLYAVLIPRFGAMGAAFATLGGCLVQAVITLVIAQKIFPVNYEYRRCAVSLGLAVAIWVVSRCLPAAAWTVGVKSALWILWPVALWLTGVVSPQEKQWIVCTIQRVFAVPVEEMVPIGQEQEG